MCALPLTGCGPTVAFREDPLVKELDLSPRERPAEIAAKQERALLTGGYLMIGTVNVHEKDGSGADQTPLALQEAAKRGGDLVILNYANKRTSETKYRNGRCLNETSRQETTHESVPYQECTYRGESYPSYCTTHYRSESRTRTVRECWQYEQVPFIVSFTETEAKVYRLDPGLGRSLRSARQASGSVRREGETCISGNCVNGEGTYLYANGAKYTGQWKNDKQHGQGTYTYSNGATYVGQFKDNKYDGHGTYTFDDGTKHVGQFKNGERNGQGTSTYADGSTYVGQWEDDKRNGQGTNVYANGEKYVGQWKDGKKNGQGTSAYADGTKYAGQWEDDKRNGKGTYVYANGEKYVGQWKDDKKNGQGTYTYANGKKKTGRWKDGQFIGQ